MRILWASPHRPSIHPDLLRIGAGLRARAIGAAQEAGHTVDLGLLADPVGRQPGEPRYTGHARVRNLLIDRFLRPDHDAVLWVDADLVRYPADLIAALDAVRDGGIAAPFVYLDRWPAYHRATGERSPRFYDTAGFIEVDSRRHTPTDPPYFTQPGPVVQLLSVGCCYLMPASLFHAGHRYGPPPHPYVEHWTICQAARRLGLPIVADRRVEAWHAYLPDFGEEWHTGHE